MSATSKSLSFKKIAQNTDNDDPLYYGTFVLENGKIPKLDSGCNILSKLEQKLEEKKLLDDVIYAHSSVMTLFNKIFPEVVESNEIGTLSKESFNFWKTKHNDITIELDPNPDLSCGEAKDVYIGGPAALFAAAIQSKDPMASSNVLYCHNGVRGISNWKGAASYHHIRDDIPVYYWPDNSGISTIYATVKQNFQRRMSLEAYKAEIGSCSNFNKLRINYTSILKEPSILSIFIKNGFNNFKDVGLHLTKNSLVPSKETTAYTTLNHASLTEEIIEKMNAKKPMLMKSNDIGRSLLLLFNDAEAEDAKEVLRKLQKVANGVVDHRKLTTGEIEARGYNTKLIGEGYEFYHDGYFPPYTDGLLEGMITEGGGEISDEVKLTKILVVPTANGDCEVTRIIWKNEKEGKEYSTPVKTLFLSLGPSMRNLNIIQPDCSLYSHLEDIVRKRFGIERISASSVYPPTYSAFVQHIKKYVANGNLMKKVMHAAGLSAVILIKVDKSIVEEYQLKRFRDHNGSHNKHIVRLAEKEVIIDDKHYQFFALQATGGGHFPIKYVHADAAINVLKANVIPVLGLHDKGIEFDIISARSCSRGVTGQNVFRIAAPLANMAMIYGVGGIGISTMAPNGLLLKAIQASRQKLSIGEIEVTEYKRQLKESDFGKIPHWSGPNPFARNYSKFVDHVDNPMIVAKRLGVSRVSYLRYARNILARLKS